MVAGLEIKINEHGIFITTPKTFQVKSNEKVIMEGEYIPYEVPVLPQEGECYLHFVGTDTNSTPLANRPYVIFDDYGEIISEGVLDENGETTVVHYNNLKNYHVHIMDDNITQGTN